MWLTSLFSTLLAPSGCACICVAEFIFFAHFQLPISWRWMCILQAIKIKCLLKNQRTWTIMSYKLVDRNELWQQLHHHLCANSKIISHCSVYSDCVRKPLNKNIERYLKTLAVMRLSVICTIDRMRCSFISFSFCDSYKFSLLSVKISQLFKTRTENRQYISPEIVNKLTLIPANHFINITKFTSN